MKQVNNKAGFYRNPDGTYTNLEGAIFDIETNLDENTLFSQTIEFKHQPISREEYERIEDKGVLMGFLEGGDSG